MPIKNLFTKENCLGLALSALSCIGASAATIINETFSSGIAPAGWFYTPEFNYSYHGSADFSNGRANAYAVDTGVQMFHPVAIATDTTKLTVSLETNLAFSSIGESTLAYVGLANGDRYYVQLGYGDVERPTGEMSGRLTRGVNNFGPGGTTLQYFAMPKVFDNFTLSAAFQDGYISFTGNGSLGESFHQTVNASGLQVSDITSVGFALYTTTNANVWVDNYVVTTTNESVSIPVVGSGYQNGPGSDPQGSGNSVPDGANTLTLIALGICSLAAGRRLRFGTKC